MIETLLSGVNWTLICVTIVGGPAVGYEVFETLEARHVDRRRAMSVAVLAGAAATLGFLAASYGLYLAIGLPRAWVWIERLA